MNRSRLAKTSALLGAAVGLWLAYIVISDLRNAVSSGGTGIPGFPHVLACWPVLLALFVPTNTPQFVFYGLSAALNAATFAVVFILITRLALAGFLQRCKATEIENGH